MAKKNYTVGGFPATTQQIKAIELGLTDDDVIIEAGAGTGKTTLLASLAKEKKGKGLYITFNKAIAEEGAKVFPRGVRCKTAHSLAYAAVGKKYRSRLKRRLSGGAVAKHFNLLETCDVSSFAMGNLAIDTVRRFCYSDDIELEDRHVPKADILKIENEADQALVAEETLLNAQLLWSDMCKLRSKLPITHDFYLKKWALSEPDLKVDYILFDEAQDTNAVMIGLMAAQNCQIIWVGDTHQSIYRWRGAVNAMERIDVTHSARISQSFRFGVAIAGVANAVLANHVETDMRLTGFDPIDSQITKIEAPDAIICRTNAEAMRHMIDAVDQNMKVTFSGGVTELTNQITALRTLSKTSKTNHVDFAMFKSYKDFAGYAFSKGGGEFKPLVVMIKKYGFDYLLETLNSIKGVDEDNADMIISTAHKAKGLEWDNVKLGRDFKAPGSKGYRDEESNLLYVAVTRAKKNLDISECQAALLAMGMGTEEAEAIEKEEAEAEFVPTSREDRELNGAIAEFKRLSTYLEGKGVDLEQLKKSGIKRVAVKRMAA